MKRILSFAHGLIACGIALAMISTAYAQNQRAAKVVRVKGHARYTTGNNVWQPLKVGTVLRPGTVIQTSVDRGSFVDLVLTDAKAPLPRADAAVMLYQPRSEQELVRIWENSVLAIDKLSSVDTGTDVVTETQLDLRAGRILGNVKKMSAASKYEVKIPNGVAGIRGTIYDITAEGVVRVLDGSLVIAYVGSDGTVTTQVVMGGQQFDARTGQITPIPSPEQGEMLNTSKAAQVGVAAPPSTFTVDKTIYYVSPVLTVSPTTGNGDGNGDGD